MPRDVSAVSSVLGASNYRSFLLVSIDHASQILLTDCDQSITQTITVDGLASSLTFTPGTISFKGLGQTQGQGYTSATLTIGNVDNFWSSIVFNTGVRETRIQVWNGYFNSSGVWQGAVKLFDGKLNGVSSMTETQIEMTLSGRSPWVISVPGELFVTTCTNNFKGRVCGYGVQPPVVSPVIAFVASGSNQLPAGSYSYWVTATDASGESAPSPTGIITTVSAGHISITWTSTPFTLGAGAGSITGYKIYGRSGLRGRLITSVGSGTTTFTDDSTFTLGSTLMPAGNTTGPQTSCDKTSIQCAAYANQARFRGFRNLPDPNKALSLGNSQRVLPLRQLLRGFIG